MNVFVNDLKQVCIAVLNEIESVNIYAIRLDVDAYWNVLGGLSGFNKKYSEIGVGSFSDDLLEIQRVINRDRDVAYGDIERFGNVVWVISKILNKKKIAEGSHDSSSIFGGDLIALAKMLLKKIERASIKVVNIPRRRYWAIPAEIAFDFSSDEPVPKVFCLSDDWNSLQKLLNGKKLIQPLHFELLGRVIKAVAETLLESDVPWFMYSRTWAETKQDVKRLKALEGILINDPGSIKALIEKGFLYFDAFHKPAKARMIFKNILKIKHSNVDALFWLSQVLYHDFFEYKKAKTFLKKAILLDPNSAKTHVFLAQVLYRRGKDLSQPIYHFKEAVLLEPG